MVVQSLDPGDDRLLVLLAHDVARAMWRLSRVDRWEANGLSWLQADEGLDEANWLDHLGDCDEAAAVGLCHLGDGTLSTDALWNLRGRLGCHPQNNDATELPDDATGDEIAVAIFGLLDRCYSGHVQATSFLRDRARELHAQATAQRDLDRPFVVRREMTGDFMRCADDARRRKSGELDKALHRFNDAKDRSEADPAT